MNEYHQINDEKKHRQGPCCFYFEDLQVAKQNVASLNQALVKERTERERAEASAAAMREALKAVKKEIRAHDFCCVVGADHEEKQ